MSSPDSTLDRLSAEEKSLLVLHVLCVEIEKLSAQREEPKPDNTSQENPVLKIDTPATAQEQEERENEKKKNRRLLQELELPAVFPDLNLLKKYLRKKNEHFFTHVGEPALEKIYDNSFVPTYDYGKVHVALSKAFHEYKQIYSLTVNLNKKYYEKLQTFYQWFFTLHVPDEIKFSQDSFVPPDEASFLEELAQIDITFGRMYGNLIVDFFYDPVLTTLQTMCIAIQELLSNYFLCYNDLLNDPEKVIELENHVYALVFQNHLIPLDDDIV